MTDESQEELREPTETGQAPVAPEAADSAAAPSAPVESPAPEPAPPLEEPPIAPPPADELPPHMEAAYRRLSRRLLIITTLIVVVVFASAAFIGSRAISRRFEGARKLDEAQRLVERADGVVLELDEVVRGQLSADLADRAADVRGKLPAAKEELERAVTLIDEANDSVTEDEQQGSALLRASAEARLNMIAPADAILEANMKAGRALEPAKQGWTLVLAAEKTADEAVAEYNKLNAEGVAKSSELSSQTVETLRSARAYFSEAATAFPEAGFDRYLVFIDGKIAILGISQQSNAAWLAGNIADANTLIARYNADEQQVIAAAKALPSTPAKAVADAYERVTKAKAEEYFEARKAATKADAAIDAY